MNEMDGKKSGARTTERRTALEALGRVAAREPVSLQSSALGMLLFVCGLVGFGYWLRGTKA